MFESPGQGGFALDATVYAAEYPVDAFNIAVNMKCVMVDQAPGEFPAWFRIQFVRDNHFKGIVAFFYEKVKVFAEKLLPVFNQVVIEYDIDNNRREPAGIRFEQLDSSAYCGVRVGEDINFAVRNYTFGDLLRVLFDDCRFAALDEIPQIMTDA
jgi:hypothetical protein